MKNIRIRDLTQVALLAALLAVSAWIAVPIEPPFTLQILAVFTAVGLFGMKKAFFAVLVYLALGAVGLPVFSGFRGGVHHFVGSGGYLFGFLLAVLVAGALLRLFGKGITALLLAFFAGLAACYLCSTVWYLLVLWPNTADPLTFWMYLFYNVLVFLPADLVKIAVATFLTRKLSKGIKV